MGSVAPAEGLSVAGKYRLVRPLARGSMGEVWVASHETLGGELAIKFMTRQEGPDNEDPATAMARFQFEAQVAARLSRRSRHIVAVTDHGQEWDQAYLVMELVEGESLGELIRRQSPLDLSLVATIVSQLAKGLSQAHVEGLFHRDLKPANVLLTRDEEGGVLAKILDFGIAKATRRHQVAPSASNLPAAGATRPGIGHETEQGIVLGTPNYMSPEQARGLSTLDHRCDVWALGVIAYEALTGTLPYDGETTADLLVNICTTRSVPASRYNPDVPAAIGPFFLKAFAPKVGQRFQSAVELAEALLAIARDTGRMPKVVSAPPPPPAAGQPASTHRSAQVPPASSAQIELVDKPTARTFTTGTAAAVPLQTRWGLWGALAALVVAGIVVGIKLGGSGSGVTTEPSSASNPTLPSKPTSLPVPPPPPSAAVLPVDSSTSVASKPAVSTTATAPKTPGTAKVPPIATTPHPSVATAAPTPSATLAPPPTTTTTATTTKKSVDKGEIL